MTNYEKFKGNFGTAWERFSTSSEYGALKRGESSQEAFFNWLGKEAPIESWTVIRLNYDGMEVTEPCDGLFETFEAARLYVVGLLNEFQKKTAELDNRYAVNHIPDSNTWSIYDEDDRTLIGAYIILKVEI